MMPSSNRAAPVPSGTLPGPVPSCIPAGPFIQAKGGSSSNASTSSDPWLGGASITTRPISGRRLSSSQTRRRIPPIECVTKCTFCGPQAATAGWIASVSLPIRASVEG